MAIKAFDEFVNLFIAIDDRILIHGIYDVLVAHLDRKPAPRIEGITQPDSREVKMQLFAEDVYKTTDEFPKTTKDKFTDINFKDGLFKSWKAGNGHIRFPLAIYFHCHTKISKIAEQIDKAVLPEGKSFKEWNDGVSFRDWIEQFKETENPANPAVIQYTKTRLIQEYDSVNTAVSKRIVDLKINFSGRGKTLDRIDDFIDATSGGLMIVSAPAGTGKSALLAKWYERRIEQQRKPERAFKEHILAHFFSNQFGTLSDVNRALSDLVWQFDRFSPWSDFKLPYENSDHHEALNKALRIPPIDGQKLILILDSLDEASQIVEPLIDDEGLAENVYVIISGRKETSYDPEYLRDWAVFENSEYRIALDNLGDDDIKEWLEKVFPEWEKNRVDELGNSLKTTTEGLALFLSFVIDDLDKKRKELNDPEILAKFIEDLPNPFHKYLWQQLDKLAGNPAIDWDRTVKPLFALLSILKGPISSAELDIYLKGGCPSFAALKYPVTRWLLNSDGNWSFSHPRLARTFAQVIGLEEDQVKDGIEDKSWLAKKTERGFIKKMEEVWNPEKTSDLEGFERRYALDWLAVHLIKSDDQNFEDLGIKYLSNPKFMIAQMKDEDSALFRFYKSMDLWASLPTDQKIRMDNQLWTAFWAENEVRFGAFLKNVASNKIALDRVLHQMFADAAIFPPEPPIGYRRAVTTSMIPFSGLVRRLNAHSRDMDPNGIHSFYDGFISYGRDGAIVIWDKDGTRIESGGHPKAHTGYGGVEGIHDFGDGFISYGGDGAVLIWNSDGKRIDGAGHPNAHTGDHGVKGIHDFGDGFISYGGDGAIVIWNSDGTRIEGAGHPNAHTGYGGVEGIHDFGDGFISYGDDGAIVTWDKDGTRIEGAGHPKAHSGDHGVKGIHDFGDGFISYGGDGAVIIWNSDGKQIDGAGHPKAHTGNGGVEGIHDFGDGFISYGDDGAIVIWDKSGTRIEGAGHPNAHTGDHGVCGILDFGDGFISYGDDGAIVIWDKSGARIEGAGHPKAHSCFIGVKGIHGFGNGFLSYGGGAILVWDSDGKRVDDAGHHNAHTEFIGVKGIHDFGDGFISYGDGAILVWDKSGARIEGAGQLNAHTGITGVEGIHDFGGGFISYGGNGDILIWEFPNNWSGNTFANAVLSLKGIYDFGEGFITRSSDGAILVWNKDGERIADAGCLKAHIGHNGEIGIHYFGNGFISYGGDGAILVWNSDGKRIEGAGDPKAHTGKYGVTGIHDFKDGFISYGYDGAIVVWDSVGKRVEGAGHPEAHTGIDGVKGIHDFGDGFISYGGDGAIVVWDKSGTRIEGAGHPNAHTGYGGVEGIHDFGDGFISYGGDGAIVVWDKGGKRVEDAGHPKAHSGYDVLEDILNLGECFEGVSGIHDFGDGFISYGDDGAIVIWDKSGARIEGAGHQKAHSGYGGVKGIHDFGDGFISYGGDGAIVVWDKGGKRIEGVGHPKAHTGPLGVEGVHDFGNGFISFGGGAIVVWDKNGNRIDGAGHLKAHTGNEGVLGICDFSDGFVSYGDDGVILLWDYAGRISDVIIPPRSFRDLIVDENRIIAVGDTFWIYEIDPEVVKTFH